MPAESGSEEVLDIRRDFSLVGPNNLASVVPAIEATLAGRQLISLESSKFVKLGLPISRLNSVVGIVEIASGCLSRLYFLPSETCERDSI